MHLCTFDYLVHGRYTQGCSDLVLSYTHSTKITPEPLRNNCVWVKGEGSAGETGDKEDPGKRSKGKGRRSQFGGWKRWRKKGRRAGTRAGKEERKEERSKEEGRKEHRRKYTQREEDFGR
jgi:hypothetical protein